MVMIGAVCIRASGRPPYPLEHARAAGSGSVKQAAAPEKHSTTKNARQKAMHAGRQETST